MLDYIHQLAFVHHGTKGAFSHTVSAENTLVVVNLFFAMLIFCNGTYWARLLAGNGNLDNGVIGAVLHTQAAVYTGIFVNVSTTILDFDAIFYAVSNTGPRKAGLAVIRYHVMGLNTGITGFVQNRQHGPGGFFSL
jgi:hypothetical protein